jgi:hypothetical protein
MLSAGNFRDYKKSIQKEFNATEKKKEKSKKKPTA